MKKLLLMGAAFTAVIVPAIAAEKPVSSLLLCAPAVRLQRFPCHPGVA
jgi:hypothetical protein